MALLATLFAFSLPATMDLPTDLKQLAKQSDLVFKGVCKEKRQDSIFWPKLGRQVPIIVYRFEVKDAIKGNPSSVVEFKQWAFRSRGEAIQFGFLAPVSTASFEKEKTYLLFLGELSENGFRSVIGGAGNGVFEVVQEAGQPEKVVNLGGNRGLFQSISKKSLSKSEINVVQAPPGPVPYSDFVSLVKKVMDH